MDGGKWVELVWSGLASGYSSAVEVIGIEAEGTTHSAQRPLVHHLVPYTQDMSP